MMRRILFLLAFVPFMAQAQLYKFMASPVPATSAGVLSDFGRNLGTGYARWDSVLARYGIFTSHGSFGGNLTVTGTVTGTWQGTSIDTAYTNAVSRITATLPIVATAIGKGWNLSAGGMLTGFDTTRYARLDLANTFAQSQTISGDLTVSSRIYVDSISNPLGALVIPNSLTVTGDVAINGSNLTSTSSTFNLFPTNVTTLNIGSHLSATLPSGPFRIQGQFPQMSIGPVRVADGLGQGILNLYSYNTAAASSHGYVRWYGNGGADTYTEIGRIVMAMTDANNHGMNLQTLVGGTLAARLTIARTTGSGLVPGDVLINQGLIVTNNLGFLSTGKDIGTPSVPVDTLNVEDPMVTGFANFAGTNTGTATLGAGDSIQVTLTGFTATGVVIVTYTSNTAMTTAEIPLAVGNKQTNKFTIFGSNGETANYFVAKK